MPHSRPSSGDARLSRWLSKVLRHDPQSVGLVLDAQGWVAIDEVLAAADTRRLALPLDRLLRIVEQSDKQRFSLSPDGRRIRAVQGHSVAVDLDHPECVPPPELFHGTVERFVAAIMAEGLRPQGRHHVHLSPDIATARAVGQRRGPPVILRVDSAAMAAAGHRFWLSPNGVWLAQAVPPAFLSRS